MVRSQVLSCPRFYTWFPAGATAALLLMSAVGCECGGVPRGLRVDGPHPYVRCFAADPQPDRQWQVGSLELTLSGRQLHIDGPSQLLVAVYGGPAFTDEPSTDVWQALHEASPDLSWMIGGIGDTSAEMARNLTLLSQASFPTLILAGGRDRLVDLREALRSADDAVRDRIVDATALRSIRWRDHVMIPVAGAVDGRYARDKGACGIGRRDLAAFAKEVGEHAEGARRWLVSWQAPARWDRAPHGQRRPGPGIATVGQGADIGDPYLAELAQVLGVTGGLFAWPEVQVMRPRLAGGKEPVLPGRAYADLQLVVPSIAGPGTVRDDGSWQPAGFALLRLDEIGMMLSPSD